jgi:hypothetical protein
MALNETRLATAMQAAIKDAMRVHVFGGSWPSFSGGDGFDVEASASTLATAIANAVAEAVLDEILTHAVATIPSGVAVSVAGNIGSTTAAGVGDIT